MGRDVGLSVNSLEDRGTSLRKDVRALTTARTEPARTLFSYGAPKASCMPPLTRGKLA
jgi:hypothetical protein